MGLKVDSRPRFKSLDPSVVLNDSAYQHWGTFRPGGLPEPNNLRPPEDCSVGNFSEAWEDGLAGWADAQCSGNFTFICKILRGWRRRRGRCCISTCVALPVGSPAAAFCVRGLPLTASC
jgi:hypothetical protein